MAQLGVFIRSTIAGEVDKQRERGVLRYEALVDLFAADKFNGKDFQRHLKAIEETYRISSSTTESKAVGNPAKAATKEILAKRKSRGR